MCHLWKESAVVGVAVARKGGRREGANGLALVVGMYVPVIEHLSICFSPSSLCLSFFVLLFLFGRKNG